MSGRGRCWKPPAIFPGGVPCFPISEWWSQKAGAGASGASGKWCGASCRTLYKKQALAFRREYAKKTQVCQSARCGSLRNGQGAGGSAHRGYGHDGQREQKESDHFYVHPVNLHDVSSRCQNDDGVFYSGLYLLVTNGERIVQKAMTMALFLFVSLLAPSATSRCCLFTRFLRLSWGHVFTNYPLVYRLSLFHHALQEIIHA